MGSSKPRRYGVSYGTYLGVTYANLFPQRVGAVVVDGNLDPIAWSTGSGNGTTVPFSTRLRSDLGAQATLGEFFRLCDAGTCAFGPDSADRYAALVDRLKTQPVEVTLPDGSTQLLDWTNLVGMTLGAMYDSLGWEDFAHFLADVESGTSARTLGAEYARLAFRPAYMPRVAITATRTSSSRSRRSRARTGSIPRRTTRGWRRQRARAGTSGRCGRG